MQKEIFEQPKALADCLDFNKQTLTQLTTKLKAEGITNVVIAARGTSDHAGIYGKYLIESLVGIPVGLSAASVVTLYGGKISYKNMLVIGISQSGKAADSAYWQLRELPWFYRFRAGHKTVRIHFFHRNICFPDSIHHTLYAGAIRAHRYC